MPGLGVRSVARILKLRRHRAVRLEELNRLGVSVSKIAPFVGSGHGDATSRALDRLDLRARIVPHQLSLFDHA